MPIRILAVIPHPAFSELLRLSLEEGGEYRVHLTQSGREALAILEHNSFPLAILDSELRDLEFIPFFNRIKNNYPEMKLIVIPPGNDTQHPSINSLRVDGYLNKPFYLPDLNRLLNQLLPQSKNKPENQNQPSEQEMVLENRVQSAQMLANSISGTEIQSVVLLKQMQPWAAAGNLEHSDVLEITGVVARYWQQAANNNLIRFTKLGHSSREHLIYAQPLVDELILILLFDINVPLSRVRNQAGQISLLLTRSMISSPPPKKEFSSSSDLDEEDIYDEDFEIDLSAEKNINLTEILVDVPSPDPDQLDLETNSLISTDAVQKGLILPWDQEAFSEIKNIHLAAETPMEDTNPIPVQPKEPPAEDTLTDPVSPAPHDDGGYSLPGEFQPLTSIGQLEPVSPAMSHISYTCILIPRISSHILAREVSEKLSLWVPQLCLAFNWRLAGIAIRPDYLQWSVYVNPAIPPGNIIRTMRDRTSERIFSHFPVFKGQNPSGDFWAQAYLVVNGCQPPSPDLLKDFIYRTRQRQGI